MDHSDQLAVVVEHRENLLRSPLDQPGHLLQRIVEFEHVVVARQQQPHRQPAQHGAVAVVIEQVVFHQRLPVDGVRLEEARHEP